MGSRLLEDHGTKLMELKPSSIWTAAMADMDRKARNAKPSRGLGDYEQYAFHRRHVMKAISANDLIRAAIKGISLGQASGKKATRLIYADVEILKRALR